MSESFVPIEELIKSGELSGRSALEYLEQTGTYAFHGSSYTGQELFPRQAMHNGQLDGQPAVAAATSIEAPIVRSLINRSRYLKDIKGMQSAWTAVGQTRYFLTLEDIYNSLTDQDCGYVHALPLSQQHDTYRGEVRFFESIKPNFTIETHKQDLPPAISWADFNNQSQKISSSSLLITFPTVQALQEFYSSSVSNIVD